MLWKGLVIALINELFRQTSIFHHQPSLLKSELHEWIPKASKMKRIYKQYAHAINKLDALYLIDANFRKSKLVSGYDRWN